MIVKNIYDYSLKCKLYKVFVKYICRFLLRYISEVM